MLEINGKINTAICYATIIEDAAIEQIRRMCDYEFTAGSRIRIMPDVHAGKGCAIGTTMTVTDKAVPNITFRPLLSLAKSILSLTRGALYSATLADHSCTFAACFSSCTPVPIPCPSIS